MRSGLASLVVSLALIGGCAAEPERAISGIPLMGSLGDAATNSSVSISFHEFSTRFDVGLGFHEIAGYRPSPSAVVPDRVDAFLITKTGLRLAFRERRLWATFGGCLWGDEIYMLSFDGSVSRDRLASVLITLDREPALVIPLPAR